MTARTIDLRVFVFIGFPFKCVSRSGGSKDTGETPAREKVLRNSDPSPPFGCAEASDALYKIQQEARRKG
jgi:hypothetical protein